MLKGISRHRKNIWQQIILMIKKPVPSIRVEEEFSRSPLNKLAFGFDTEVIEAINYTRLDRAVQKQIHCDTIYDTMDRS